MVGDVTIAEIFWYKIGGARAGVLFLVWVKVKRITHDARGLKIYPKSYPENTSKIVNGGQESE